MSGSPQLPSGSPQLPSVAGSPQLPSVSGSPQLPSVSGSPQLPSVAGSPQLPSVAPRVSPDPQPPSVPDISGGIPVSQEIQTSNPLGQLEQQLIDILRAWLHHRADILTPPLVRGEQLAAPEVPPPTVPQPSGVGDRSLMNEALAFIGCAAAFFLQMVAQPSDGVFTTVGTRLHACHCTGEGETQICPGPSDCIPITYIGFQTTIALIFAICGCLLARVIWGSKRFRGWMLLLLFVWTCGYFYAAFAHSPHQFRRYTELVQLVVFPTVIVAMMISSYMKRIHSPVTDSPAPPV